MDITERVIIVRNTNSSDLDFTIKICTIKIWEPTPNNFSWEHPVPCRYEMGHELLL